MLYRQLERIRIVDIWSPFCKYRPSSEKSRKFNFNSTLVCGTPLQFHCKMKCISSLSTQLFFNETNSVFTIRHYVINLIIKHEQAISYKNILRKYSIFCVTLPSIRPQHVRHLRYIIAPRFLVTCTACTVLIYTTTDFPSPITCILFYDSLEVINLLRVRISSRFSEPEYFSSALMSLY
jgi:hypothetical protein